MPKYDEDGNEIEYTIEEVPIDGCLSKVEDLAIVNNYIAPVISDEIFVTKRITGDEPSVPHQFQFILQAREEAPLPTSGNRLIDILGEGQASFETITFYQPGTYQFVISKIHTGGSGYTYDTARYVLTFVVAEVEGVLVIASHTLTKDDESASDLVFVNIYTEIELIGTPIESERPLPVPVPPIEPPPVPEVISPARPPQTNDPTSLLKWTSLFLISLIGLIINLLLTRRRNRRNSE